MTPAQRAARQRASQCLDRTVTHIRVGDWDRRRRTSHRVEFVGMAADLHGTVCTCCKRRDQQ